MCFRWCDAVLARSMYRSYRSWVELGVDLKSCEFGRKMMLTDEIPINFIRKKFGPEELLGEEVTSWFHSPPIFNDALRSPSLTSTI